MTQTFDPKSVKVLFDGVEVQGFATEEVSVHIKANHFNMTREEAFEVMKLGYKVTNAYFTNKEFLYLGCGNHIITEDGCWFGDIFWSDEPDRAYLKTGWRIWK